MRRRLMVVVSGLVLALLVAPAPVVVAAPVVSVAPAAPAGDDFAVPPGQLPDEDGAVIRSEPLRAPLPGRATRVLYRSTDTEGRPIAVTGTVIVPLLPPPGPQRLIGYAVGTQGLADRCAPSRQFAAGTEYEAAIVSQLLLRGYAVAVTDYEGLGTPGEHTYVNRRAQGQAVLDAVRAARNLGSAPDDGPVALAGYSQGGGASAAAAELAPSYAPDVQRDLVGAYAGAVPADLAAVGTFLDGKPAAGLLGYALNGFDAAYPELGVPEALNEDGRRFLRETREQCVDQTSLRYPGLRSETLTADGAPFARLLETEPFRARVDEQRLGRTAPEVPMFVTHSVADDIVPFAQGATMVRDWCAAGATVRFARLPVPTHVAGYAASVPGAFAFLEARFAGAPARSTC